MRKINFTIILIVLLANVAFGQKPNPKITATEKRQAKQIAARFYNRLAQTQDIQPLIKEFFINDFSGWYKKILAEDGEIPKMATKEDVEKYYTTFINYFYLYFNSVNFVQTIQPTLDEDKAENLVNIEIEKQLNIHRIPYTSTNFDPRSSDWLNTNSETSKDFKKSLDKQKHFISILKIVEKNFRLETKKKLSQKRLSFLLKDFEVLEDAEVAGISKSDFGLSKGQKLICVFVNKFEHTLIPCVLYLTREKGVLKILFVITPPQ